MEKEACFMTRKEMSDDEYRKMRRRENFWYRLRVACIIISLAIWFFTEIAFGMYLYKNGFSAGRICAVCIGWFFAYFVAIVCLFMLVGLSKSTIDEFRGTRAKVTLEDLKMILYFVGITVLMGGGSQFLFWYFAFK